MKHLLFRLPVIVLIALSPLPIMAQALFQTSGSWDVATNWSGSNIGDVITEDVTIDISKAAFINNGFSYTIGNLDFSNNAGLTVNTTGTLDVGQSGTPKNLTANNNATITVAGSLIVWGDLVVNNNLSWTITGTVIIMGNVIMNNNTTLSVTGGNLTVNGNFTGGSNTNVTITGAGSVGVEGTVNVGNSSNLTGPPGSFHAHGCTEGGGSSFCSSGTLPVQLLFFKATASSENVKLSWKTVSELNFDYFIVERSDDAKTFFEIGTVRGAGFSNAETDYSMIDENPSHGIAYYRLTAVDLDKSVRHLKIVSAEFSGTKTASIYPNPVIGGQLNIELNFVPENESVVTIIDMRGVTLAEFGLSEKRVTVPIQFSAGVYLVTVRAHNFQSINRVMVK